jgi:hypothetical protein
MQGITVSAQPVCKSHRHPQVVFCFKLVTRQLEAVP